MKFTYSCISAAFIALLILVTACGNSNRQPEPPPPSVIVSNPLISEVPVWDEYVGRFRAIDRVDVRARVSGYLEEINFEDGEFVDEGDVLFVIDQDPFKVVLDRAEADLLSAETRLELAEKEFSRVEGLRETGAVSQEQYDRRFQELLTARAGLASAEASVNAARLDLEFTVIKAPVAGKISENFVSKGNLVSGGTSSATLLTRIVSLDPIYFSFEANESNLLSYIRRDLGTAGSSVKLTDPQPIFVKLLDEEEYLHEGELNFIDNAFDTGTGTLTGRATFENDDLLLIPGMFGRARISAGENGEKMLIPDKSIGSDQSKKYVLVLNDSTQVVRRFVTTGPLYRHLRIITEGINRDDKVVIEGISKVSDGQKVNPSEGEITLNEEGQQ
mgnify:CR=1 FL=1